MTENIYYKGTNYLNKSEFLNNTSDKKRNYLHQEPSQMLLRNYISRVTPYENVLLYHELGTGKTCASITIAEGFKEYLNNMGKRIVVLVKNKNIEKNFMDELLSKCTHEEYLDKDEYDVYTGAVTYRGSETTRAEIINKANKTISKSYNFITYGTFINRVLGVKEFEKDQYGQNTKRVKRIGGKIVRKPIKDAIKNLNNTVVIVDEAHNITNNDVYTSLYEILSKSYNYKLILLTATPMYDNSSEIFELANLLNVNRPDLQLPIGKELTRGEDPILIKTPSKNINRSALRGDIVLITESGKKKLETSLAGKVSYLRGNKETNPQKIDMGSPLLDNTEGTANVVYCEMSDYQYGVYQRALHLDLNKDFDVDLTSVIKNIESEENVEEDEVIVSKSSSLYKNSSDASTIVYPNETYGKVGFSSIFTKSGTRYKLINKDVLTSDLQKYSTKLYTLLQMINTHNSGNIFIYSNYVSYGGTTLIKQLLLANGFYEYNSKNPHDYKSFVVFDESTNIKNREQYKRIFNSDENKTGKLIRIIIGSPIISEGITLKAVRQVHILEPYWNMSKINQIVGRAVRNYSHHALDEDQRTVEIYKYVSIYSKVNLSDKDIFNFFIDKEKYILSEEKDRSNKVIERILKEISFDCAFNISRNTLPSNDIVGSPECDYTTCNYECKVKPESERVDNSTYNMYLTFFDQFDIFFVLEHLKRLFKDAFIWSLDDIRKSIFDLEPLITDEAIYTTLSHIVDNKVLFLDKYDREGFIIRRGPYYIFNNFDIDINSSIYAKILDFSIDTNKYTLQQFAKSSLGVDIISTKVSEPQVTAYSEELNNLSEKDLEYNKTIEQDYTIYGTYRNKKMKVDKWEHKYGNKDDIFRIVDTRNLNKTKRGDQRNDITGKAATSYNLPELKNIATVLGLNVSDTHEKRDLIDLIKRTFEESNRILK
jgi:superfamily II DNA or RNA helicase